MGNLYTRCTAFLFGGMRTVPKSHQQLSDEVRRQWESEQEKLKEKVVLDDSEDVKKMLSTNDDDSEETFYVAGVDISFVKGDDVNACAALVVLSYPQLQTVYSDCEMVQLSAPYIPGFLGFREAPLIVSLFDKLKQEQPKYIPHLVMVDGNGIMHPKEFGSACHMGVALNIPCIGVAKNLFQFGEFERNEDHKNKIDSLTKGGDTFPLVGVSGKTLGMALRSCDKTSNPVYVSPGNMVSMDTAVKLVHRCCKHRVPEPVRLADISSRDYLRVNFKPGTVADNT